MLGCTARVLAYLGLVLMENRHALVVDTRLTLATETAERQAALEMVADHPHKHRITLGADKAYDVAEFVADLREYNLTPHVAQNTTNRRSAIDGRTTRHSGYAVSGQVRKRIEEVFGWTKAAAGFRKTHHRGLAPVGWMFTLTATAYNLVRLPKLPPMGRPPLRMPLAARRCRKNPVAPPLPIPHSQSRLGHYREMIPAFRRRDDT
jgi:hypothetical protein